MILWSLRKCTVIFEAEISSTEFTPDKRCIGTNAVILKVIVHSKLNHIHQTTNKDLAVANRRSLAPRNAPRLGLIGREGTGPTQVAVGRDPSGRVRGSEEVKRQRQGEVSNSGWRRSKSFWAFKEGELFCR